MSSANEDLQDGKVRYFAPEKGTVVDNADPEGLYRCRIEVPGIIEKTDWAYPIGTNGGGSKGRGSWVVPEIGALVVVMFIGGDVEHPVYMGGWWKLPDEGPELPTEAQAVGPEDAYKIQTIMETKKLKVWVDEREGKEQFGIQDKDDDTTFLQFNFVNGVVTISGSTGVIIQSDGVVKITGSQVIILDKPVVPNGAPIG